LRRLLAVLALAAAAPALALAQDPPPPASMSAKDVAAWSETHLDAKGWRVLSTGAHGLFLASPDGVTLRQDHMAEADLRHELFAPLDVGAGQMRSDLERWVVDCPNRRHALLKMTLFARNNLKEELAHRETETPNWLEAGADDEASHAITAVCEAVAAGQRGAKGKPAHP